MPSFNKFTIADLKMLLVGLPDDADVQIEERGVDNEGAASVTHWPAEGWYRPSHNTLTIGAQQYQVPDGK